MSSTQAHLGNGRITAATRRAALHRLGEERYDVIVVGGGVTGAGVALDAASRGLRTALVERDDLAMGTSRWSSKLVHGGLRYLARGDIAVAWESARERHHLLTTIAPHLVRPVPFLIPLDAATRAPLAGLLAAGIYAGDLLRVASRTSGSDLPRPRRIGTTEALALAPGLTTDGLRGAILHLDGQLEDDARLVITLARTAAAYGADIVTRCAASELTDDRVLLTDQLTGESVTARGMVVNATGVWAAEHAPDLRVTASRGSHIVVRAESLGWPRAVVSTAVPGHFGRFVFAIPHADGLVHIGLTDEPAPGADGIAPPVPAADETFLLETMSRAFARPLTSADVVGRYAGLRPLVSAAGGGTADISRRHLLLTPDGGPITIAGGKLTTYRVMARDAVDAAASRLGWEARSRTRALPLLGAAGVADLRAAGAPRALVRRYGTLGAEVCALVQDEPWLGEPVIPGRPTIGAELAYGVLAEGALTAADLIERRTRLSLVDADRDAAMATAGRVLDWAKSASGSDAAYRR